MDICRPPSVNADHGNGLFCLVYSLQRRIWLCRPMRDLQTLPQMLHLWAVSLSGLLVGGGAFLRARFSMAAFVRFSSPVFSCVFRELLHLGRSAARASQWSGSICRAFMSLLQTSLNLSCGRPVFLFPAASSPYRRSLGILPSSIR